MLNDAETPSSSTNLRLPVVPSPSQRLQDTAHCVSAVCSNAIDQAQITSLPVHLSTGDECCLHVPVQLPFALLAHLASIAAHDETLALTELARYCFLLPLSTQERPSDWPRYAPSHARFLHDCAVKAYRARVRVYREQGRSFVEVQRLALPA